MRQRTVPQGRLKMSQDGILGYFYLSMYYSRFEAATQDLRPGTFSVVPAGLILLGTYTQHSRAGLFSASLVQISLLRWF